MHAIFILPLWTPRSQEFHCCPCLAPAYTSSAPAPDISKFKGWRWYYVQKMMLLLLMLNIWDFKESIPTKYTYIEIDWNVRYCTYIYWHVSYWNILKYIEIYIKLIEIYVNAHPLEVNLKLLAKKFHCQPQLLGIQHKTQLNIKQLNWKSNKYFVFNIPI